MPSHDVLNLIKQADHAISTKDFDALMDFYADDAVLVVQPGQLARGKAQIKRAFHAIVKYFDETLTVTQGAAQVLDGEGTALVIMETHLQTSKDTSITRRATYVFKQDDTLGWLCTIDNSYGTSLLNENSIPF